MHAPEVKCIGKSRARQPYEFGMKVCVAISHATSLVVGVRSFAGNPYHGNTVAELLEQCRMLMQGMGAIPPHMIHANLGNRGVDAALGYVALIHRDK